MYVVARPETHIQMLALFETQHQHKANAMQSTYRRDREDRGGPLWRAKQIWRTDRGHPASSLPQEKEEKAPGFNAEVRTEIGHSVTARAIYHLLTL